MSEDIQAYNSALAGQDQAICKVLSGEITTALHDAPEVSSKVWHGHPVWFLDGNPIVGYAKRKNSVQLLFWSGQSFDERGLVPEGSFKAAQANYTDVSQISSDDLQRWLGKAQQIQWDYKNIVKRRGQLERLA